MSCGTEVVARLYVLERFSLTAGDGRDVGPKSTKSRALLTILALSPGGTMDRGRLAGLLWSESADAKSSLRQSVKEIRRCLGDRGLDVVEADTQKLRLDLQRVWVDVLALRQLLASNGHGLVEFRLALYRGELLEGLEVRDPSFDEWVSGERERLSAALGRWLQRSLDYSLETQALEQVEQAARALLALDATHEAAHRALMRRHAAAGDLAGAIRQYQACKAALAHELDVLPAPETEALMQQLQQETPPLPRPREKAVSTALVSRAGAHATIVVEERAIAADAADATVGAAFAAGLREALARKRWLSVIEPAATRLITDPGAPSGTPSASYRVSVAFVRLLGRARFSAELVVAHSDRLIRAEHYDRGLGSNVFAVVDQVAGNIARRLEGEVELAQIIRASRQPAEAMSSYDCVLRAIPLIFKLTPDLFAEADRLLQAAQLADPNDPLVYAWRSFRYFLDIGQGWVKDLPAAKEELDWLVRRAIELDPKNALALAIAGHISSFVNHDYDRALGLFERSLELDPNSAYAWDLSAVTLCYTGKAEAGLQRLQASRELWQRHPHAYYFRTTACIALLLAGQYERAAEVGRRTVQDNPNFKAPYRPLIASLGHSGRIAEARTYLDELRRVEPEFTIDWFRARYPPLHGDYGARYIDGLRKAGVPEA